MKLTMYNMELWFEPKEARPGYVLLRARTLKDMRNYMLIVTAHEADQISDAIFNAAEDARNLAKENKKDVVSNHQIEETVLSKEREQKLLANEGVSMETGCVKLSAGDGNYLTLTPEQANSLSAALALAAYRAKED